MSQLSRIFPKYHRIPLILLASQKIIIKTEVQAVLSFEMFNPNDVLRDLFPKMLIQMMYL